MRIEIWGGRGEGKTTLAHKLKEMLEREGCDTVHLITDDTPPNQKMLAEREFSFPRIEIWERH